MRIHLIAHMIAETAQCVLVWLVVTITNRKADREWGTALECWKAAAGNAPESVEEMATILTTWWQGRIERGPVGEDLLASGGIASVSIHGVGSDSWRPFGEAAGPNRVGAWRRLPPKTRNLGRRTNP